MTRLVVFQNPDQIWAFNVNSQGVAFEGFPAHFIGKPIEEIFMAAASILKYWVEEIKDNEYCTGFEITHDGKVTVKQSGLRMEKVEKYGGWNDETKSLDIHPIGLEDIAMWDGYFDVAGVAGMTGDKVKP